MEKQPTLMRKGVDELQKVNDQKQQDFVWNHPNSSKIHPSKASQAVKAYYEKQAKEQRKRPSMSSYVPEMEALQKYFLMRPGCPQYSNQGTSPSFERTYSRISEIPINLSTMSLTSQVSLDDWNYILMNSDADLSGCNWYQCSSSSEAVYRLPKWKSFTEGIVPHLQVASQLGNKIPWYISVLHDKDLALRKLGEELTRLTPFESECTRKDEVISVLLEEVKDMQQQLDQFEGKFTTVKKEHPDKKSPKQEELTEGNGTQRPWPGIYSSNQIRQKSIPLISLKQNVIPEELQQEAKPLKVELTQLDRTATKTSLLDEVLLKDEEERGLLGKEQTEINQKRMLENGEDTACSSASKLASEVEIASESSEDSENILILYKLWEFQKVNEELYEELQRIRNDYDIATGTVSSLQRQLSFEKSQLRTAHVDRDLLQKELRERGAQLDAMSNKFCNLREERKLEDLMGSIERDNYKLRQNVARLESQLAEKNRMIQELQSSVSQFQTEMLMNQNRAGKQLTFQNDLQRQLEVLQRAEQQTRVTLESISARFDRFRSKIIQATYSTPGTKSPQAEITDEEVLESLQKIITDRQDFHQLLKQKGIKVPALSSESTPPPTHKKKAGNK